MNSRFLVHHRTPVLWTVPGLWHSVLCVLSSVVCWFNMQTFQLFTGYQWILCHTLGGQNLARSWILGFNLSASGFQYSQMALFFQILFDCWYFRSKKHHSALWEHWKPFELWVLALERQEQRSCNMFLLHMIFTLWLHIAQYTAAIILSASIVMHSRLRTLLVTALVNSTHYRQMNGRHLLSNMVVWQSQY